MSWSAKVATAAVALVAAGVLGSATLFATGVSRDEALQALGATLPKHVTPPVEKRDPCSIDPPPPAVHPFDRSALVVESAVSAEREAQDLRAELLDAERKLKQPDSFDAWSIEEDIDQRRTLYVVRFGKDACKLPEWKAIADDAARILAEMEALDPPPVDWHADSYAATFRVLLLDLAGRSDEAARALSVARASHWCGNCLAGRQAELDARRSEAAERRGDMPAALVFLDRARSSPFTFSVPAAATDARHGLLMLDAGRESSGICLLQRVVDLFPKSAGAEVARAALLQMGALRQPNESRIRAMYVDGRAENNPLRMLALEALSPH
ncbi:MAG TPA: hypothetical protein VFY71_06890 [Planctomycetota bacterium]|nr:hypothetical protein [Planctomycetota bacterium]